MAAPTNTLATLMTNVTPGWKKMIMLAKSELAAALEQCALKGSTDGTNTIPEYHNILRAFTYFDPYNTKLVIIGQDPYPNPLDAMGLSFSAPTGRPIPASLKNVYKSAKLTPTTPNLENWARQGVLLLNKYLTYGKPPHTFWEPFTNKMIEILSTNVKCTYFLWGNEAKKIIPYIKSGIFLTYGHPSPLNTSSDFSQCPHLLSMPEIDFDPEREAPKSLLAQPDFDIARRDPRLLYDDKQGEHRAELASRSETSVSSINTKVKAAIKILRNPRNYILFTDGACLGNGKANARASWGVVCKVVEHGIHADKDEQRKGSEGKPRFPSVINLSGVIRAGEAVTLDVLTAPPFTKITVNVAEIIAAIVAIDSVVAARRPASIIVLDSEYVLKVIKACVEKRKVPANPEFVALICQFVEGINRYPPIRFVFINNLEEAAPVKTFRDITIYLIHQNSHQKVSPTDTPDKKLLIEGNNEVDAICAKQLS